MEPQSRDEVDVIERELRRLDDDLRIKWEPKAVLVRHGSYDALGQLRDPIYDGRWAIVKRADPNRTAMWREDGLVTYVTQPQTFGSGTRKIHAMTADGPYAPIGWWLVEHMQSWDRANREYLNAKFREDLDAMNERNDAAQLTAREGEEVEGLEQLFFAQTMRGGVSVAHPVKANLTRE